MTSIYQAPQVRGTLIVKLAPATVNLGLEEYTPLYLNTKLGTATHQAGVDSQFIGVTLSTTFKGTEFVTVQTHGTTIVKYQRSSLNKHIFPGSVLFGSVSTPSSCTTTNSTNGKEIKNPMSPATITDVPSAANVIGRCLEMISNSSKAVYAVLDRTAFLERVIKSDTGSSNRQIILYPDRFAFSAYNLDSLPIVTTDSAVVDGLKATATFEEVLVASQMIHNL